MMTTPTKKKATTKKSAPSEDQMLLAILNQLDIINEAINIMDADLKHVEQNIKRLAERIGLPL